MADKNDDLEYSETNVGSAGTQGVRKNISLKLREKGRGKRGGKTKRASAKKLSTEVQEDEGPPEPVEEKPIVDIKPFPDSHLDEVLLKLEAPTFSPLDRTFPEPLHQKKKLRWDHKVNLIGEKVMDPLIHCCEKCNLPILIYLRMVPCKHVFCYECGKKSTKVCMKCQEKVSKFESSALGSVFMCMFGGARNTPGTCGRTYLSSRDLHAHMNHRHLKPPSSTNSGSTTTSSPTISSSTATHLVRDPRDPRAHLQVDVSHPPLHHHPTDHRDDHQRGSAMSPHGQSRGTYQHSPAGYQAAIPVSSSCSRPNLITVPIQDDGAGHGAAPPLMHYAPSVTPPLQPQHMHPPPANAYQHTSQHSYQHNVAPPYSQAPPTQPFNQPPPSVHHPSMHAPQGQIYSAPPPVHHAPPATYTPPRGPPVQHQQRPMPPQQRFPQPGGYEEPQYMHQQWAHPPGNVHPNQPRAGLPQQSNPNVGHMPPRGPPPDQNYRPSFYQ